MSRFSDHFSNHASEYAAYRPTYPVKLADFLAASAPRRAKAWEAGCGSGQFTRLLVDRFDSVVATDASAEQLQKAPSLPRVTYSHARAEESGLEASSIDFIVVAQAVHWFDIDAFYAETRRVGRPDAVIGLFTYGLLQIDDDVDAVVRSFYDNVLDGYWPPERDLVESGYRTLPFPFNEIETPLLEMRAHWSLAETLGYVETWSGVQALANVGGTGAIETFRHDFESAWGLDKRRMVRWPLALRMGHM